MLSASEYLNVDDSLKKHITLVPGTKAEQQVLVAIISISDTHLRKSSFPPIFLLRPSRLRKPNARASFPTILVPNHMVYVFPFASFGWLSLALLTPRLRFLGIAPGSLKTMHHHSSQSSG